MKKIIVSLLPVVTSAIAVVSAIDVNNVQTISSCNAGESHEVYYYIQNNENYTIYPDDTYWNTNNAFIRNDSSVEIYNPRGVISKCDSRNRMSNMVRGGSITPNPLYPALILRNEDGCIFSKQNYTKTNYPTMLDAQIHYTVRFNLAGGGTETNEGKFYYNDGDGYLCYPDWNKVSSNTSCSRKTVKYWDNVHSHTGECLNYHVFWCGDGLVNGPGGLVNYTNGYTYEACDPEAPERKNRADGNSCTASCTIKYANSSCGSLNGTTEYNTQYPSQRITENTPGLCGIGQVVPGSLVYNKTTGKYTWSCKNETATAVSCTAQDLWCGDGVLNGGESCDDGDKNGTSNSTCSKTCTVVGTVSCGTSNGGKTYFSSKQTSPWLTTTSAGMCAAGLTVGTPTIKGTDYHLEWTCSNANGASTTCKAYQEYCGDNIRQPEHESCDDGDKNGTSNSTCSKTCTVVGTVSCGTSNGGKTYFSSKQTSPWLTTTSAGMCAAGLTVGTPTIKGTDYHLEWTCSNANGASTTCKAYQEYCGDNIRQPEHESCDDGDKNGTSNSTCSKTCTMAGSVSCGTGDGGRTYFSSKQTSPWLTTTSAGMCAAGLTVGTPTIKGTDYHLEWTCSNANGASTTCKAYQEYCGDKIRQSAYEECDYNDEGRNNFGNDGCDTSCRQKVKASDECDDTFYYTLRHKKKYTFYDTFIPTGIHYLYDFDVKFVEKDPYDYNRGPNPSFYWSGTLVDGVYMKVSESRVVLESKPEYEIKDHPNVRSQDNLYIEYNIKYADFAYPTRPNDSQLKNHKECVYYEISRCGDGIIDTGYAETCDPKDTTHTGRGSGGCDEETCQPITSVVSPVCNSQYNGKTVSNLVEGDYLCTVGTVSDFKYNENTHKWTWKCNNAGSSVDCYANKPQDGSWRIEKTLTGKKIVESTGEILTWQVRVRAEGGNVTNFKIQDIVPFELEYKGYSIIKNNDNLQLPTKPSGPVPTATGNIYTWNVTGTLQKGHELVLEIKTRVVKMPEAGQDIENVACIIKDGNVDCSSANTEPVKGELEVKKTLISENKYVTHTGQELEWKITVKAKKGDVEMERIKDKLPAELKYERYTREHIPSGITVNEPTLSSNGKEITWITTGTLKSGNYIELHVVTTVVKMPENKVKNVACAKPNPGAEECGTGVVSDLRIKKYILDGNKKVKSITGEVGDTITYKIDFGNDGDVSVLVILKDYIPKGVEFKSGKLVVGSTSTQGEVYNGDLDIEYNGETIHIDGIDINAYTGVYLQPHQKGELTIVGKILERDDTESTTNFACIFDKDGNKIDCDNANHSIKDKEQEDVSCKPSLDPSSFARVCEDAAGEFSTTVTCKASEESDIEIRCDGDLIKSRNNVKQLIGTCSSDKHNEPIKVKCKINGSFTGANGEVCESSFRRNTKPCDEPDESPKCLDKATDITNKTVTCKSSEKAYIKIDCGDNHTHTSNNKVKKYEGTCDIPSLAKCYVSSDKSNWTSSYKCGDLGCFNVNAGNFSIEEGEILPFYWNMNNMDEIYKNTDNYTEIDGSKESYNNAPDIYSNYEGSCSEDDEGKIAKDSMVCVFNIYDGGTYHKGGSTDKPLYTIEGPCLSKEKVIQNKELIKAWYNTMIQTYCNGDEDDCEFHYSNNAGGVLFPTAVYYIEQFGSGARIHFNAGGGTRELGGNINSEAAKSFGEYKLELSKVKFLECHGKEWVQREKEDSCQNDFMLTNSYTVQKTPSGNLSASTEKLSKYRYYNGTQTFKDLLDAIQTTEYKPNAKVESGMNAFIDKYSKLAVTLNTNVSYLEGANIKKVPGKNIYFVEGTITIKGGGSITKSFTIVQTTGNTIISGNIDHNMMLLTKGDIVFKGNCKSDQQVKGIFYAKGNLSRGNTIKKNTDIDRNLWCTNGGLHVKGVLIGEKFDTLMDQSRSNLNSWFKVSGSDTEKLNQRRKLVMNGASVVIEYSPSIFTKSTMPPGAEDFTTALSIYKN